MNKRILALPVDARPVVREQVQHLARIAGWDLQMPDKPMLGHFRTPADRGALRVWLKTNAGRCDGIVLSLDMLVYGGLVPSRFIEDDEASIIARLDVLRELKREFPDKPIYGFAATMRMSNNNYNEEEKLYWAQYGMLIWQWSFMSDRFAALGNESDKAAAEDARKQIPDEVAADYLATRARNCNVTQRVLQLASEGVIDRLILPQDDTAEFGFNIAERRRFEQWIADKQLSHKVLIYPGADEVMHTLCAHLFSKLSGATSLKVFLTCSDPTRVERLRALYEDRPVLESVRSQVAAVGAHVVGDVNDCDVVLAIHTRGSAQGDWAMRKALPAGTAQSIDDRWLASLKSLHGEGKPIVVVDLAFANGADPLLIETLEHSIGLRHLAAYAGWNTAGNTIGSAMAQAVFGYVGGYDTGTNGYSRALRLLEDYFYQSHMRQIIRDAIDEPSLTTEQLDEKVSVMFTRPANEWAKQRSLGWRVTRANMPWNRTFEIDLQLESSA
jgi:hypothetical protein